MTNWAQIFTGLFMYAYDTPSGKTGLWQLPIVSTAFKKKMCLLEKGYQPNKKLWSAQFLTSSLLIFTKQNYFKQYFV